jgi:hypothetical protein
MRKQKTIIEQKMEDEIYPIWDYEKDGVEKARNELKKMYFQQYNSLTNIEDKRLILHNLTTAEITLGTEESMTSARLYSKTLIDVLDNFPNYTNNQENKQKYVKALNNYTECYREELSDEELIEIYEFCYETYKRCDPTNVDGYLNKLIAEFNLNLIKKNFNVILRVIKDTLHNNQNSQYEEAIDSFMEYIKNTDNATFNQAVVIKTKCTS